MDADAWAALVDRARQMLSAVAQGGATITYGELRRRLGTDVPSSGDHDLAALLRAVSVAEDEAGRGLLSAVVVRPSGRPGAGWYRLAEARGRDVSDPERAWETEIELIRGRHRR